MIGLLKKEQAINIVPQDFKDATRGKVVDMKEKGFSVELNFEPQNIPKGKKSEFYSSTENGILYFEAKVLDVEGKILKIENPVKHRYLQRRQFTRIKFINEMALHSNNKVIKVNSLDLSAGGMKIQSKDSLDIDTEYMTSIELFGDNEIRCLFEPIRIEKSDDGIYTVSGRFKNMSNVAKMTLVQLCIKKNLETVNKKS
ncbi:MAG TPA: PilZ domain-containing protein [Candidatus Gastranaerophilaceae bacterium]|nr:PilZ domain-containing protein [Candidatus Gastranaerophilaceae bacterium]HPT41031.1 PilZ domain-containing protein [Candidatus Gastranaerophilaceae bacterium]